MIRAIAVLSAIFAIAAAVTVSGGLSFDRDGLMLTETEGMTVVSLAECGATWEVGAPSLPIAVAHLVIPQDMKVTGIRLDYYETEPVEGEFDVWPVQKPRPISESGPFEYVSPDPAYYGAFQYPSDVVTSGGQGSMSGYNIASVFVAPVQHTADERKLVFHPEVRFTVEMESEELDVVRIRNRSEAARRRIEENLAGLVLNPEDLAGFAPAASVDPALGPYDHVVITSPELAAQFATMGSFIESNMGLNDTVVTTDDIYASYQGGDNPEKVRNFIKHAYSDWSTTHILLAGDCEVVPHRQAYGSLNGVRLLIACDLYYSDLDRDWNADGDRIPGEPEDSVDMYPDVYVGRVCVDSPSSVERFTGKLTTYAGDSTFDYLRNILLTGFDLDSSTSRGLGDVYK